MDIFFYWQKLEQDLKNGQVGNFGSNNTRVIQLAERLPKRIWVFKTPKGMRGSIQLLGSLVVSAEPRLPFKEGCGITLGMAFGTRAWPGERTLPRGNATRRLSSDMAARTLAWDEVRN
jgi:hypothetical protein